MTKHLDSAGPLERPIILQRHEARLIVSRAEGQHVFLPRLVRPPADGYYKRYPQNFHSDFRSVGAAADSGWIFWTMGASGQTQAELDAMTRRIYREGILCPYGMPADLLWGKETWAAISPDEFERPIAACVVEYRADGPPDRFPGQWPPETAADTERPRWRSPLTMPRWASRIGLEVVNAFPRRLQDIDATGAHQAGFLSIDDFRRHWDAMHSAFPWSLNPWAWFLSCVVAPLSPAARPPIEEEEAW